MNPAMDDLHLLIHISDEEVLYYKIPPAVVLQTFVYFKHEEASFLGSAFMYSSRLNNWLQVWTRSVKDMTTLAIPEEYIPKIVRMHQVMGF